MKTPSFRRSRQVRSGRPGEHGITMVLVAICLIAIIAIAALSIDVITLYLARSEAQRAADAAALAAARVISISGITGTADPDTETLAWVSICGSGTTSAAFLTAQAVALANAVGGGSPSVDVTYSISGSSSGNHDCSGLGRAFAVNPTVIVKVTRNNLPTLFSRIWRGGPSTVSATAAAEAFNSSDSARYVPGGDLVPVKPRCIKPWIIPNEDPGTGGRFVDPNTGKIQNTGIRLNNGAPGIIGERFTLRNDCKGISDCAPSLDMIDNPPIASTSSSYVDYIPSLVSQPSGLAPSCAISTDYQQAIGGCDLSTTYSCGNTAIYTQADLSNTPGINPGSDTSTAVQCLIHQTGSLGSQDSLAVGSFPFQIQAGTANPIVGTSGQVITASNSIVTVPIYGDSPTQFTPGVANVNIVGFLQIFINSVDASGNMDVYVLNVVGCGNDASTLLPPAAGTSPVPIRLITTQ